MKNNVFNPTFFKLLREKQYTKEQLIKDFIAGVIVCVVALPLAIAFGIASGVTPQQGLITAVIAGFFVSLLGGSNTLIGGPTGSFIVIVFGIVSQYGVSGLLLATIMAGVMLVFMGAFKIGGIIRYIPYPIVVGFTSGIAIVIFTSQVKDFLGLQVTPESLDFISQWKCFLTHVSDVAWQEVGLGVFCILTIVLWPKVSRKIPGSLIAIFLAVGISLYLSNFHGVHFTTIGSKFPELANGVSLPKMTVPTVDLELITALFPSAFTIALLCAIETLMSAIVADGITGQKHDSNTELIGQGVANIISPFFGGIPATGAMARTMANINNGGSTPVSGLVHAFVVLLIYLFLLPYAVNVPLAALSAILIVVSYNMSEWRSFKYLLKGERSDIIVLLITFFLTVLMDLNIAIEVGLLMAVLLFVRRVTNSSKIEEVKDKTMFASEDAEVSDSFSMERLEIPSNMEVFQVEGPFFFGLANKIEELEPGTKRKDVLVRIIRMRRVPFIDSTGVHNLQSLCHRSEKAGVRLILSGVTPEVHATLRKFGLAEEIGEEYILPHIVPALEKANAYIAEQTNAPRA